MGVLRNLETKTAESLAGFPSVFYLSSIDGKNGFQVNFGEGEYDKNPHMFSGLGDFNGDGIDDFLSGVSLDNGCYIYIVLGRKNWDGKLYNPLLDKIGSIEIKNTHCFEEYVADGPHRVGDINGDGLADVLLYSDNGVVIYGSKVFNKVIDADALDGKNGFRVNLDFNVGHYYLVSIGDVNGDGRSVGYFWLQQSLFICFLWQALFPC